MGVCIEKSSCLDAAKEVKDLERVAPNVTVRCCVTTSRASPNQPFVGWPDVEESSVFLDLSMRRPEEFSRFSLRMSSEMLSPTPSMPRGRLSLPWMWSTHLRDRDVPSTDSAVKLTSVLLVLKLNGFFQSQYVL